MYNKLYQIFLMTLLVGCGQAKSQDSKQPEADDDSAEEVSIALAEPKIDRAKGKKKPKQGDGANPNQSVSNFEEPGFDGTLKIRCNRSVSNQDLVPLTVTVKGKKSKKKAKASREVPRACLGDLSLSVSNSTVEEQFDVSISLEVEGLEYNYDADRISNGKAPRVIEWKEQQSDGFEGTAPQGKGGSDNGSECANAQDCPKVPCEQTFKDGREICAI